MSSSAFRHPFTLLCAAAAFLLGLLFPGRGALFAAQGGLPEATVAGRAAAAGEVDPWTAYYRVLAELDERYYGDLPGAMPLTYTAIRGMLRTLEDPFTRFMDPSEYKSQKDETTGDFVGIGIYLDDAKSAQGFLSVTSTVPNGPAAKAGLRKGDRIYQVNTRALRGMKVEQVSQLIRGRAGTSVRLSIRRATQPRPFELRVVRQRIEFPVVTDQMKEGKIGYIHLSLFNAHADEQVTAAIHRLEQQGMKGLILDLRDNPGGMLEAAIDLVSRFVPPGNSAVVIVESGGRREAASVNAGKFLKMKTPMVVLVNGDSASASEILAGAIKDNAVGTIIGERTFGKGLVQSVIETPGKTAVAITSAKYLTSHGNDINRIRGRRGGVEPDVPVALTEKDLFLRRDPQMDKAMEVLREKIAANAGR
jgi:carboxyl-terminal processing protease